MQSLIIEINILVTLYLSEGPIIVCFYQIMNINIIMLNFRDNQGKIPYYIKYLKNIIAHFKKFEICILLSVPRYVGGIYAQLYAKYAGHRGLL